MICNEADETSTEDTFLFGNGLKRPEFCKFVIFGDFIKKVDSVDTPAIGISPSQTPATSSTWDRVKVTPSALILDTLLNTGSVKSPLWYEIIDSVLIPTLPENLLNGQVAVAALELLPRIPKISVGAKLGNILS